MRQWPFYLAAKGSSGNQWGPPFRQGQNATTVLACSTAIYDAAHQFRGVVAIELALAFVRDQLIPARDMPYVERTLVLGPQGGVLVDGAGEAPPQPPAPITIPAVMAAVRERRGGFIEFDGRAKLAILQPLTAAGWTYLAVADTRGLLEAPDEPVGVPPGPRRRKGRAVRKTDARRSLAAAAALCDSGDAPPSSRYQRPTGHLC